MDQYNETKTRGYIILPLGNHDNARMNVDRTSEDLEIIMAFGITMPGVPFIYYGNEIGMRQLVDMPQVEGAYKPRAGARTPMQWTPGRNRGFSAADPSRLYLPVDAAADAPNVADQEKDPNSLLNRVRRLIRLKHDEPALAAYADFVPLFAKENTYPFVYARVNGNDALLVILNPSTSVGSADFPVGVPHSKLTLLAGREVNWTRDRGGLSVMVPWQTYAIYKMQ